MFTKSFHQILFYKKNEKKNNPFTPQPAARRDPCWRAFTHGLSPLEQHLTHRHRAERFTIMCSLWQTM